MAIIGASDNNTKIGGQIFNNAARAKNVNCFPINPKHQRISGYKCYPSVLNIKDNVDIALIVVKAEFVASVLNEVAQKKIPFAIIISSGFKETGEAGKTRENELQLIANRGGVRLLGPNCLGLILPNINLSFGPAFTKKGDIMVISQSGAIGASLIDYINEENVGIRSFISLGNKADLSENDFLEYLNDEKDCGPIFLYLESFAGGRKFFELCRRMTPRTPIVILKPGSSKNSKRAMTSHTGALVSDVISYKTAFQNANVIDAATLEDFFKLMKYFSLFSPRGKRTQEATAKISIITNAGGMGVLLADLLPSSTPQDIGGGARPADYEKALRAVPKNISALFLVITPQTVTEVLEICQIIVRFQPTVNYPIFSIIPGGTNVHDAHLFLKNHHCLVFDFPEDATRIFGKIQNYKSQILATKQSLKLRFRRSRQNLNLNLMKQHEALPLDAVQKLANEYQLPLNHEYVVLTYDICRQIARRIGYPVVLKAHGEKLLHKTEFNAVRLNISNEADLHQAYHELLNMQNTISVSKQIPASFEVIIGVKRDPDFGHLLMFGMGGIYTEIMKDLSYGLLPLAKPQIVSLIKKTRSYQIINGARHLPKLCMRGIVDTIEKLNKLILENQWISELDINPLLVGENFVEIVDLKIK